MFSDILISHSKKYPLIQPKDTVKLCYQSVFGVSHFISGDCLKEIQAEYDSVLYFPGSEKFVPIGNGYVRAELKAFRKNELPLLAEAFEKTSHITSGTKEEFEKLLAASLETVRKNSVLFSFSQAEFYSFICEYKKAGYPPVRHSDIYKAAYHPAYRVISKDYVNSFDR